MASAWKPTPRPRWPVSNSDPVKLMMDALWPRSSWRVCRVPEADHVPSKVRDSPGAGAPSGPGRTGARDGEEERDDQREPRRRQRRPQPLGARLEASKASR